jgi:O-antigen ligase
MTVWLVVAHRRGSRLLGVLATSLVVVGLVLSFSRGAWLAVGAAVVLFVVLHREHAVRLALLASVGLIATSLFISSNPSRVAAGEQAKQVVAQANVNSRLTLYRGAVDLAVEHPVLGIGPGNFGGYYYVISGAPPGSPPLLVVHDTYLEVAAELGVPGFALLMTFLALVMTRLSAAARQRRGPPELAAFVRLSLVAVMVGFLTLSEEFFAPVWLVGGLATMLYLERTCASST